MSGAFDLAGRVIWVTGSSRGIGRGVATHLAAEGASVVVHGRSEEALEEIVKATGALPVVADVRDAASLTAAVDRIRERLGRLDGLVVNVGGAAMGAAAEMDAEWFRRQLDLNVTSAFATARAAHPLLREGGGAVVFVSASGAAEPTPQFAAYGAAKAAVEHLTGSLAAEWGPQVRVNCIAPGLIRTEGSMQAVFRGSDELVGKAGAVTAVGRIGEPEDIALACQYLLSGASAYVSGAVLRVDGGLTEGPTQRILRALAE